MLIHSPPLPVGVPLDGTEAHLYEQENLLPDFAFLKLIMDEHVLGEGRSPVSTGHCNVEFLCPGSSGPHWVGKPGPAHWARA